MRDVGKVKDRFELKLDTNRVFFLFAGLAAYSALIFVLGIVVGRQARPEAAGSVASAPVMLPDERPTPQRIEERLGEAQPKATEEQEIPLKAMWDLDKAGNDSSLTAAITATPKPATPKPAETAVAAKPTPTAAGGGAAGDGKAQYTLQVIAYNDLSQAQSLESTLKKQGFDAYTVTAQVPGKGTVHRVRVGHYPTRTVADNAATQLAAAVPSIKPLVVAYE